MEQADIVYHGFPDRMTPVSKLGTKVCLVGNWTSGLEAIMKRFPPRSDALVSNLYETPSLIATLADKLANRMTPDRAMQFTSSACTAFYDLEIGSHLVLDVAVSAFLVPSNVKMYIHAVAHDSDER
ncbi:hypothetical protein J7T55_013768 [Diaporthe amygdali]|uniref:uncharacterized protein n=1 Tax=Phomopsis amygdali TaxID=1214568 RepID=UPI0022FDCB16|nr:uncharacterized protein J7T55_013768 [Diaporthe amygdali]KAJ0119565.1 hypothetical protein J7T55_013768 [Diaporthe amygdali]